MRFRKLGRTGLLVSEISLGTVEIGLDYGMAVDGEARRPPEWQAKRLLNRALDLGINFIDTARGYGESEGIIGRALKGRRSEFVLCSKVLPHSGETFDGLRHKVTDSVDMSLRSLDTDFIDIMMVHNAPGGLAGCGEMITILEDLRRQGKFRWIGASVYGEDAALDATRSGRYDCLQIAYSILDRRPESRLLPEAQRAGIGTIARSVLLKGVLTPRYRHLSGSLAELSAAARELEAIARNADMSLPELAYRYVLSRPLPHTALVGASVLGELESAVHFAEAGPLAADIILRVRKIEIENDELLNPGNWPPNPVQIT